SLRVSSSRDVGGEPTSKLSTLPSFSSTKGSRANRHNTETALRTMSLRDWGASSAIFSMVRKSVSEGRIMMRGFAFTCTGTCDDARASGLVSIPVSCTYKYEGTIYGMSTPAGALGALERYGVSFERCLD